MNFFIDSKHPEFFKDYYDLIKIFVYDVTLKMEGAPKDFSLLIFENIAQENHVFSVTFSINYKGKDWKANNSVPIIEQDPILFKKEYKKIIKITFYDLLVQLFGKQSPWGSLTGVRPSYLLYERLAKGDNLDQAVAYMQSTYDLSTSKADLLKEVVQTQLALPKAHENDIDVYIGIPFCATRCTYCTFPSNPSNKEKMDLYLLALQQELYALKEIILQKQYYLRAFYIGGGTPTALDENNFALLLETVNTVFGDIMPNEYTVEAGRADTINKTKLQLCLDFGVKRISINPQTMNNSTLKVIGRNHTAEQCKEAFYLARNLGFQNINMDTILGLPGENEGHVAHTMQELQALKPDSITVHTLAYKKNSIITLNNQIELESIKIKNMLDISKQAVQALGMRAYYLYRQKNMYGNHENVAYAYRGKECLYNVDIMEENTNILAAGAGAISKIVFANRFQKIQRAANVGNVDEYIKRISEMILRKNQLFLN